MLSRKDWYKEYKGFDPAYKSLTGSWEPPIRQGFWPYETFVWSDKHGKDLSVWSRIINFIKR